MSASVTCGKSRDWLRQPLAIVSWWGVPLALAAATDFLSLSLALTASIWAVAFVWMGTGCVLNAPALRSPSLFHLRSRAVARGHRRRTRRVRHPARTACTQ